MSDTHSTSHALSPESTMEEVLEIFPSAQRALFARYHIGGCASCGFDLAETLGQLCRRNDNIDVEEVIAHLQHSHEEDQKNSIAPEQFEALRGDQPALKILDIRTREEHEAVALPGSTLLTQELWGEVLSHWERTAPIVIYDHSGKQSLDAVAYFLGHGFSEVKSLAGGIDRYAQEIDPSLPRYRIELSE